MVAQAAKLERARTARPTEWDALMPYDGERGTLWQVWMRRKGLAYWVMRYAAKLARLCCRIERALGRDAPPSVINPNALEDGGTFATEDEAKDLCRIYEAKYPGWYALTYTPVLIGRAYRPEPVQAAGDRYFDPFMTFDFSATDAVKEQANHILLSVDDARRIASRLTGITEMAEPRL